MQFLKRFINLHKTASNNYGTISYKILKVLNISSSTVHTITKSFYESDGKGIFRWTSAMEVIEWAQSHIH